MHTVRKQVKNQYNVLALKKKYILNLALVNAQIALMR